MLCTVCRTIFCLCVVFVAVGGIGITIMHDWCEIACVYIKVSGNIHNFDEKL